MSKIVVGQCIVVDNIRWMQVEEIEHFEGQTTYYCIDKDGADHEVVAHQIDHVYPMG